MTLAWKRLRMSRGLALLSSSRRSRPGAVDRQAGRRRPRHRRPGRRGRRPPEPRSKAGEAEPEPAATPPDWKGLRRDTGYFLGYQFVVIGVLYVMPTSVTNWDRERRPPRQVVGQRHPSHLGRGRLLHQLHPASVLGRDVLHPRPGARPEPLGIARLLDPALDPVRVRRRGPVREAVLPGPRHHAAASARCSASSSSRRSATTSSPRRARSTAGTSSRWSSPIRWVPPTT